MQKTRTIVAIAQVALVLHTLPCLARAHHTALVTSTAPIQQLSSGSSATAAHSLFDDIDALERAVYGRTKTDSLSIRVSQLELATSGQQHDGSLRTRVDALKTIIQPDQSADKPSLQMSADTRAHIPAPLQMEPHSGASAVGTTADSITATSPPVNGSDSAVQTDRFAQLLTGKVESSTVTTPAAPNPSLPSDATLRQLDAVLSGAPPLAPQIDTQASQFAGQTSQFAPQTATPFASPPPAQSFPGGQLGAQPTTQVAIPHMHPHARAFARNLGVALNATLKTAAVVAGTAMAAYANSSYSYGTSSYATRDLCACHYHRGF